MERRFDADVSAAEALAREAEEAMHCADVGGANISVQIYNPRKGGAMPSEFSPTAAPFVPTGAIMPYPQQVPPQVRPRDGWSDCR